MFVSTRLHSVSVPVDSIPVLSTPIHLGSSRLYSSLFHLLSCLLRFKPGQILLLPFPSAPSRGYSFLFSSIPSQVVSARHDSFRLHLVSPPFQSVPSQFGTLLFKSIPCHFLSCLYIAFRLSSVSFHFESMHVPAHPDGSAPSHFLSNQCTSFPSHFFSWD